MDADDVDGKIDITLSNGIYVDCLNLKPRIQNRIRRMAAFSNPVFYKNQKIGTSNFDTPGGSILEGPSRRIYSDSKRPAGGTYQQAADAGIKYEIKDERQDGGR